MILRAVDLGPFTESSWLSRSVAFAMCQRRSTVARRWRLGARQGAQHRPPRIAETKGCCYIPMVGCTRCRQALHKRATSKILDRRVRQRDQAVPFAAGSLLYSTVNPL